MSNNFQPVELNSGDYELILNLVEMLGDTRRPRYRSLRRKAAYNLEILRQREAAALKDALRSGRVSVTTNKTLKPYI